MAYDLKAEVAVGEFGELVAYGRKFPDLGKTLGDILYSGAPPFRAYVDDGVAEAAADANVVYQLSDRFRALLLAGRALDGKANDVPERRTHS
jgi:hypothetical protein